MQTVSQYVDFHAGTPHLSLFKSTVSKAQAFSRIPGLTGALWGLSGWVDAIPNYMTCGTSTWETVSTLCSAEHPAGIFTLNAYCPKESMNTGA